MKKVLLSLMIAAVTVPAVFSAEPQRFLRFEMTAQENGEGPTRVNVRVPLALISVLSNQFDEVLDEIHYEDQDIDWMSIWNEVKEIGPNEYVEVNTDDTYLRITTTDDTIVIVANDKDSNEFGSIEAEIPMALVDAILGGINGEDLADALASFEGEELFSVTGDKLNARAWVEVQ